MKEDGRAGQRKSRMGDTRHLRKFLLRNPKGKRPLERPERKCNDNIKIGLNELNYDISSSHSVEYDDGCLLGCCTL
jgi:hypothetical protein